VLLKRGLSATLDELLMAAEYILKEGNEAVMLCERGIRTFETAYRFTLDLMAMPVLKELTHLPVIVDPSHAAGRRDLVLPLSLAAAAAGADGIIVEVHPHPDEAICDGPQAARGRRVRRVRGAVERRGGARRQGAQHRLSAPTIAVVGVGASMIGGSIGLAARERLGARCRLRPSRPGVCDRRCERGAIARGARRSAMPSRDRDVVFVAVPSAPCSRAVGAALAAAPPTAWSPTSARPSARRRRPRRPRFVGGHPLAGAETRASSTRAPTCSRARPGT
jgi:hypothetical protein